MRTLDDPAERAWRACCYVGPYEISTGMRIALEWPRPTVLADPASFTTWVHDTWPKWQIRRERRAARTPRKMSEALLSAASWAGRVAEGTYATYDEAWRSMDRGLRFYGRYAGIKVLEALHRGGVVPYGAPDIRPANAWSPRTTLAWLFPEEDARFLRGGDRPAVLAAINQDVLQLQERLAHVHPEGRVYTLFELEVLLCNYRQALVNKYPGRAHDTDLKYGRAADAAWGYTSRVWDFRRQLFDPKVLGESGGGPPRWVGVRDELGTTLPAHGYFWSDLRFDYTRTTDLASPVAWEV